MNWITANGATVTLTGHEVAALADAAARYDVLGGHEYNPTPMVDVGAVFSR